MSDRSTPKRILMTCDTVGGVLTYAIELARVLGTCHGASVALATMGKPLTSEQRACFRQIPNLTVFESGFKLEWMQEPWEDVRRAGDWLLELEEFFRPDIIHLNGYVHGVLPWRAPKLVVGHSCVLSWYWGVRRETAPACWNRYRQEVARGLNAADLVVAPSKAMLSALDLHYAPGRPSRVIPNGRDPKLFHAAAKEPFILAAGRIWDEGKNIRALQSVVPRLSWPVYIAGDDEHPEGGRAECESVCFLGCLSPEELSKWYGRASIYALPARYEPFGLTILEAALAGCALVLGDIPSLREIWGDAALFIPPDDVDGLAHALNRLISDPIYRSTLAKRAHARAQRFTPEQMAAGYMEAYSQMVKSE